MKKWLFPAILCSFVYSLYSQTQVGSDIDGEAASDESGYSVSLSADGNRLAVGARYNDDNGNNSGHTKIYDWNGSSWTQVGSDIDGEAASDQSGYFISLSADGSRVAIGAPKNDGNGSNSGHVRIYEWDGSSWNQLGSDIDGEAAGDELGTSLSLSADGSLVAIGAKRNDDNGSSAGHARIYDWDGSAWNQLGSDIDGEAAGDQCGSSVSLAADGSRVAIGALSNDDNGSGAGHIRIFDWNGSSWVQAGSDIYGGPAGDNFSQTVSLSADGSWVAGGSRYNDSNGANSGQVRIFQWDGSSWVKQGSNINGEAAGDQSGSSLSLSEDGSYVAIGALYNTSNDRGHVRIYNWDGSSWVQVGNDINGEADNDRSGNAASMSYDGSRVAIGALYNDGNGTSSGHVRVYSNNFACSGYYSIPTATGTYTSSSSHTSGGWTHYCDVNNKLLLSLEIGSSGAVVAADEVQLKIGSSVTDYYAQDCGAAPACFIDLVDGAVTFNREWDVDPTTQPSSNVGVKLYFSQTEYDSVNTRIDDLGQTQLTGKGQMWFYKVTNNGLGTFPVISDITESDVQVIYNHATTPATDQWVLDTKITDSEFSAEFEVSSFSGGGGGGAGSGRAPLPVDLIYFHASSLNEQVILKWSTASEINNRGFAAQRSLNGRDWIELGFITGAGTTIETQHYSYTDVNPLTGLGYYRLQQVDLNGNEEYSLIQSVDLQINTPASIGIFPNPAKDFINITNVEGRAMIYTITGQLVKQELLKEKEVNTIQIADLQQGMYQVTIIKENGELEIMRFSKY